MYNYNFQALSAAKIGFQGFTQDNDQPIDFWFRHHVGSEVDNDFWAKSAFVILRVMKFHPGRH
jgi:hypothetical protein